MIEPDSARNWPDDTRYFSRCAVCSEQFLGPKRAGACWPCFDSMVQRTTAKREAWVAAMTAEYGPYISPLAINAKDAAHADR